MSSYEFNMNSSSNWKVSNSNPTPYSNAEMFSKFDTLMKQMEKHRAQLFQKVSDNLNKGNTELKGCRDKLENIIAKVNNLENTIDQSRDKWRQRHIHETELLASFHRSSSVTAAAIEKDSINSSTLRSPIKSQELLFNTSSSVVPPIQSTAATPNALQFSSKNLKQQPHGANVLAEKFLAKLNNTSATTTPSTRQPKTYTNFNLKSLEENDM